MFKINDKKVSVIIPCYNQSKYVSEALISALNQTYNNIEIVVVNDGSSDNSSEVIKEFTEKYKNISFFDNKENNGVVYSRNMAIERCSGEYILPLDADDKIKNTYVEKAVEVLNTNPDVGIVYCDAELFGAQEGKWGLKKFNKDTFLFENCIFCSAMFRKKDWQKAGKYNKEMKNGCEDWDLWISIIELGYKVYKIPETLFYYRKHTCDSHTSDMMKNLNNVRRQIFKNHIELYMQNDKTFIKLFDHTLEDNFDRAVLKLKKYKKLFSIFLIIASAELLVIFCLILYNFLG